jgi:hypothetical protein
MGRRISKMINLQRFQTHKQQQLQQQPQEAEQLKLEKQEPSWEAVEEDDDDDCLLLRNCSDRSAFSNGSSKSVRFGDCQVRSYPQVLGDHPYCSMGCPLELGWDFEQENTKSVNDFEAQKCRRSKHELLLSPEQRRTILSENKVSEQHLRKACRRRSCCTKSAKRRIQREFFDTK